jgi:hypothetical protein
MMPVDTQKTWSGFRRAREQPWLDDSQVREALFRRLERYLRETIAHLDERGLLDAVEASTPGDTVARVISAAPTAGMEQDPWSEALLRGAAIKQEAIGLAGGLLSSGEVAELLGVSVAAVKQRQRRGKLLAVPTSNGEWGYPARQFSADGRVHDGVPVVLSAFPPATSAWAMLSLFVNPVPGDPDGIAFDAMSHPAAIAKLAELARTFGEQGAT